MDIEEPTASRFGIYDQKELENRSTDENDIKKHARMYFIYYKFFHPLTTVLKNIMYF